MKGKLYIVSTPIGNLEDITIRAINILKEVDIIACEDTRTTRKLLNHYGIKNSLTSYHDRNEILKSRQLLKKLKEGKKLALVSDAGTPCISDPGFRLIRLAVENDLDVIPIPGVSATIAALTVSGLPTDSFLFVGFFPKVKKRINELLIEIKNYPHTLIFYESPKRVVKTLNLIQEVFGNRNISVSREITKMFEETIRGKIDEVINVLNSHESLRGEITVVVEGNINSLDINEELNQLKKKMIEFHKEGLTLKDTVSFLSKDSKISKNILYSSALEIWGN
ncbi:MAG: 16S rRNA (cytidine(1402)-2'-O)-methyltransferase [Candidatus Dadabacteria bacterium]|nr:16S rRNA (cytidine(1402)-2'-O)-methyltransferase [Candidatus Dadabacteria bacterium]NIQ16440.1 16S rRNA (cytidine(1402)-2'-O)-methyltransferase [Candidatus Dadabacteria bacterium]